MSFGFVYVLHNPAMPGVYKVGATERSPHQRAEELSRGTGVPAAYEVAYYGEVEKPFVWEAHVHRELEKYRINHLREFFRAPLLLIITTIQGDGELLSSWDSDMAAEAKTPGLVWAENPLWFEKNLHDVGYLERIRRSVQ